MPEMGSTVNTTLMLTISACLSALSRILKRLFRSKLIPAREIFGIFCISGEVTSGEYVVKECCNGVKSVRNELYAPQSSSPHGLSTFELPSWHFQSKLSAHCSHYQTKNLRFLGAERGKRWCIYW